MKQNDWTCDSFSYDTTGRCGASSCRSGGKYDFQIASVFFQITDEFWLSEFIFVAFQWLILTLFGDDPGTKHMRFALPADAGERCASLRVAQHKQTFVFRSVFESSPQSNQFRVLLGSNHLAAGVSLPRMEFYRDSMPDWLQRLLKQP